MTRKYITIEAGCVGNPPKPKPTVSVIVPIYNVEKFLDQALDSIQAQTLENIEIICVNDGSTDGSLNIMKAHAATDERIRIVDKPNGGYGSAMNCGLDEACGTWVAILEPDDWIEPTMYADLTSFAGRFSEVIDIVKSPYWRIWLPDTPEQHKLNCRYRGLIKPASQPFKITDPGVTHILRHHPSIWSALYRREFLVEENIRFPEHPGAAWDDNAFLAETVSKAQAIAYLDRPYYCYREETPEQTIRFTQTRTMLPIERWHDMLDIYEREGLGDNDEVMRTHINRGFIYLKGIVEQIDLSHDEIRDAACAMFARMDDRLVFASPEISPGWKRVYAELKGIEAPEIPAGPYRKHIVGMGLHTLRYTDPRYTIWSVKDYIAKRNKRNAADQ